MQLDHYACKRVQLTTVGFEEFLRKNTEFVGEARFTDYVFGSGDTDKDLQWVRHIHKNVWPSMRVDKFYPFHKAKIEWKSGFQQFTMPIGKPLIECSSLDEAKRRLPDHAHLRFSFSRTTKEYKKDNLLIYFEEIEQLPITVEFVCRTEDDPLEHNKTVIDDFLRLHDLTNTIPHQVATLVLKKIKA